MNNPEKLFDDKYCFITTSGFGYEVWSSTLEKAIAQLVSKGIPEDHLLQVGALGRNYKFHSQIFFGSKDTFNVFIKSNSEMLESLQNNIADFWEVVK